MELKLKFPIEPSPVKISHDDKVLLLGSCFSDEIHDHFRFNGFNAISNPFGTVFHPLVLSRFLKETIDVPSQERGFQRDDVFLSWDASASVYAMEEKGLQAKMQALRKEWRDHLKESKVLIITFGTAWGYRHKELDLIVANCHKLPSSTFEKILSPSDKIVSSWNAIIQQLKEFNSELNIVFTVSPVRHVRDGLVENSRSKAHLITAVEHLSKENSLYYFPSYEIISDELRDYRFFKQDMAHPNEQAVSYVWDRFSESFFNEETLKLCSKVKVLRNSTLHKTLHPESRLTEKFGANLNIEISSFLSDHPQIVW